MTDKEKLADLLPYCNENLEDILTSYLRLNLPEFSPSRLLKMIQILQVFMLTKLHHYERAMDLAYEKATYLKAYLQGKMWKDEASAKANVGQQINNVEAIIRHYHIANDKRSD